MNADWFLTLNNLNLKSDYFPTLSVYADYLEESGNPIYLGYRNIIVNGNVPFKHTYNEQRYFYTWYKRSAEISSTSWHIDSSLFDRLKGTKDDRQSWKDYWLLSHCLNDLAKAYTERNS